MSTFKADKYLKESRQAYARNLLAFADDRGAVVVARSDFQPYQRFYFFYHVPCIDAYFIETDNPFRYRASALQSWDIIACTISVLAERTRLRVNRELDSTMVRVESDGERIYIYIYVYTLAANYPGSSRGRRTMTRRRSVSLPRPSFRPSNARIFLRPAIIPFKLPRRARWPRKTYNAPKWPSGRAKQERETSGLRLSAN